MHSIHFAAAGPSLWKQKVGRFWGLMQVLDTGMGTPKHPLFLLGKKYRDEDSKPNQATAGRLHTRAVRFAGRDSAPLSADAASNSHRHVATAQHVQQRPAALSQMLTRLQQAVQSALRFPSSFLHVTPHRSCNRAQSQGSLSIPSSVGSPSAALPSEAQASMQQNSDAQIPNQTNSLGCTARLLHSANPSADPASSHTSACLDSAVDLEAQNGQHLSPGLRETFARTSAARSIFEQQQDSLTGDLHDDTDSEPADVAAERAIADRLWAERSGQNSETADADSSGPAILLHNLRKVCKVLGGCYKTGVFGYSSCKRHCTTNKIILQCQHIYFGVRLRKVRLQAVPMKHVSSPREIGFACYAGCNPKHLGETHRESCYLHCSKETCSHHINQFPHC